VELTDVRLGFETGTSWMQVGIVYRIQTCSVGNKSDGSESFEKSTVVTKNTTEMLTSREEE
jgi:hypothetical protein